MIQYNEHKYRNLVTMVNLAKRVWELESKDLPESKKKSTPEYFEYIKYKEEAEKYKLLKGGNNEN